MKISIIYVTARENCPMIERPNVHQFTVFLDSLVKQTFRDFEVLICDVLYKERNKEEKYDFSKYPFSIKHLDPSEFGWARKKKLICIADNYNLGIIHTDGELLLWFNDCCELVNEDSLQLWWDWYQKGYFANALVVYYKGNKPFMNNDAISMNYNTGGCLEKDFGAHKIKILIEGGYIKDVIRDSRWKFVEDEEKKTGVGIYYSYGSQFYGYSSSDLESTLRVNGYDSNFDGEKALIDVEMGLRLERLGCKFVCDKKLWLIEHAHTSYPKETTQGMPVGPWRSNYSLMILNQEKNKITANDYRLDSKELEWIIKHGESWNVPRFAIGSDEHKLLMDWYNNPPIFNLRELRNERLKKEGREVK